MSVDSGLNTSAVGMKSKLSQTFRDSETSPFLQALSKHYLDFREETAAKQSCWTRPQALCGNR